MLDNVGQIIGFGLPYAAWVFLPALGIISLAEAMRITLGRKASPRNEWAMATVWAGLLAVAILIQNAAFPLFLGFFVYTLLSMLHPGFYLKTSAITKWLWVVILALVTGSML